MRSAGEVRTKPNSPARLICSVALLLTFVIRRTGSTFTPHDTSRAQGGQDAGKGFCEPFARDEVFIGETTQSPLCLVEVKRAACEVLRKTEQIPTEFDCKYASRYTNVVSIVFHQRWLATLAKMNHDKNPSARVRRLRHLCSATRQGQTCEKCREYLIETVPIDVRLAEEEALSLVHACAQETVTTMYEHFKRIKQSLFDYKTMSPSVVVAGSAMGTRSLFRGPICRPEHYCEPLQTAITLLESLSSQNCERLSNRDVVIGMSWKAGLGSIIHVAANDLIIASSLNAAFLRWRSVPFNWVGKECESGDFTCYYDYPDDLCGRNVDFEAYKMPTKDALLALGTNLSRTYVRVHSNLQLRNIESGAQPNLANIFTLFAQDTLSLARCDGKKCDRALSRLENPYAQEQFARTASLSVFQDHLSDTVRANIRDAKLDMKIPHPVVSIHVRRGDKHKEMKLLDLSAYLSRALPIMLAFGVQNVFLSTEDPDVVVRAHSEYSAINWFVTSDERRNPNLYQFKQGNLTEEFYLAMRNLYLASDSDFFVGTRRSNWCRLIDETQRANGLGGTYYVDAHGSEELTEAYTS